MDSARNFAKGTEFVLASCYQNAGGAINGFKLSLINRTDDNQDSHLIQVTWGTSTAIIDYARTEENGNRYFDSYRNMVVLSHNSNEPDSLNVFYVAPNTSNQNSPVGANQGITISSTTLTKTNSLEINTPLIIGGNYSGTTTTIEESQTTRRPAQGMIYWAKYWDKDLGESNCRYLASWIHETVPFYLSGYNGTSEIGNSNTEQIYEGTNLSFVAAQGLGDRYFYATRTTRSGAFGWNLSDARAICNNIIYNSIPEVYKSIINRATIVSYVRDGELNQNSTVETNDYFFLPAYRELQESPSGFTQEVNTDWQSPWSWMVASDRAVYISYNGSNTTLISSYYTSAIYKYRFLGAYITPNAQVFNILDDPTTRTLRLRDEQGISTQLAIQSGDIWIPTTTESVNAQETPRYMANVAYMFFTNNDIEDGATVDFIAANNTGGWKAAEMWNLRTQPNEGYVSENSFMNVDTRGNVNSAPGNSTSNASTPRVLCPEFTV